MSTSPYHQAGKLLQQIFTDKKSIKTVAFSKSKLVCSKATYAQVCSTIQHKSIIDSILNYNGKYLRKSIQMDSFRSEGLVYVLLYELLFGKYRSIRGGGKVKRSIMKFEKELIETKSKVLIMKSNQEAGDRSIIPVFPRYVRVNRLKVTTEEVVKQLKKVLVDDDSTGKDYRGGSIHDIYQDAHVPDLLVLSPKAPIQWHESDVVKNGSVVLQDKSSCFSALALVHGSEDAQSNNTGDFIDATAAPGNKTSHIASLVYNNIVKSSKNKGFKKKNKNVKIFAFDRSSSRIAILKERMSNLAPSGSVLLDTKSSQSKNNSFPVNICPIHEDFLKVDPKDEKYKNVTSILLDPSCSGSGIVNTVDRLADTRKQNESENRIKSLSNFQLVALKHAMSFPQCHKIVYSTCSVNQRENEDVVAAALHETNELIIDDEMKWELVSPIALQHWRRRGLEVNNLTKEQSQCLIRVDGIDGDDTNGFFVSYFQRKLISHDIKDLNENTTFSNNTIDIPKGIKGFYNGEFSVDLNNEKEITKMTTVNDEKKKIIDDKMSSAPKGKSKLEVENSKKALPRKVAKKLLWKQRQKELKRARIKNNKKK